MGSHLMNGQFQSDKYPATPTGFVPLKCTDRDAQDLLWLYAQRHRARDPEFSTDLETALRNAGFTPPDLTPSDLRAKAEAACPCEGEACGLVIACEDHPQAPVFTKYLKNTHEIVFACAECRRDLPTLHLDETVHAR